MMSISLESVTGAPKGREHQRDEEAVSTHEVNVPSVEVSSSSREALERMRHFDVKHLAVTCLGKFVGVASDRDILWASRSAASGEPGDFPLRLAMKSDVPSADESEPMQKALDLMAGGGHEVIPVFRGRKLIRMLSMREIMAHIREVTKKEIEGDVGAVASFLSSPIAQRSMKMLADAGL